MGTFELRLPDIGEGITEAEIVTWLVAVGEHVRVDQPVAEVMTDKATVELPSPVEGDITWLAVGEGHRLAVGAPMVRFQVEQPGSGYELGDMVADGRGASGLSDAPVSTVAGRTHAGPPKVPQRKIVPSGAGRTSEDGSSTAGPTDRVVPGPLGRFTTGPTGRPLAAPAVRRRAAEAGIDLRLLRGSGPAGRIEHADLDRCLRADPPGGRAGITALASHTPPAELPDTEIAVSGVRRVIADKMAEATARIPHITYVEEIDMTEAERLRGYLNDRRADAGGSLTPLAFVVRALVVAVGDHPEVNARYDDERLVVHRSRAVHVGIATQTSKGLMVPVLRHAEARNLEECADEIRRLAAAARAGTVEASELSGSTITVSSLGGLGGIMTTPIINRPEVAIVGVNKLQIRPVWDGTGFRPRTMMNLSASFDHRIIDGWDGARFVARLKELIEQPSLIFMTGSR